MFTIRKIQRDDAEIVIAMMRNFYTSPAVITDGSEKIFAANIENCLGGSPYVEGFVFELDGQIVGYGVTARGYSTEFGGECIWLEDIFVAENFRGHGVGTKFIRHVKELHPDKILRLEASEGNASALNFYRRLGFKELPYLELVNCD